MEINHSSTNLCTGIGLKLYSAVANLGKDKSYDVIIDISAADNDMLSNVVMLEQRLVFTQ